MHVITPEGEDLYGYAIPDHLTSDSTDSIALDIINDAYGDDVDTYNKRVRLSVRSGYTSYGSNSGGVVSFGPYMDALRRHYPEGSYRRYAVVTIKAWWSGNVEDCVWFDDIDDAIDYAKDFIESGEQSRSGHDSSIGEYKYRYYANVIDSESGEEVFSDVIEQRE